jgi:hypothetical protein
MDGKERRIVTQRPMFGVHDDPIKPDPSHDGSDDG